MWNGMSWHFNDSLICDIGKRAANLHDTVIAVKIKTMIVTRMTVG